MNTNSFLPIPTGDIPMPILERTGELERGGRAMPRILLQRAGSSRAARDVTVLAGLFLLVALLELCLLLRLPPQPPLVVYGDFPRTTLMESIR